VRGFRVPRSVRHVSSHDYVRPARWLAGFARVPLEPGQARRVTFRLHADRTSFTGRDPSTGTRVVEPGEIRVAVGGASDQLPLHCSFVLCGPERAVGPGRVLDTPAEVLPPIIERSNGAQ
jgi:beta-xylosidase